MLIVEAKTQAQEKAYLSSPQWNHSVDVIIVGSGFAGLMAAIHAATLGVSVMVLEKRASCGGNSIISDGVLVATGCRLQQQAHLEDSPKLLFADMLKAGRYSNQHALAKTVAEQTAEICNWLTDELGIIFRPRMDQFGGHSVARSLTPVKNLGTSLIKPMLDKLETLGISPKTGLQVSELSLTVNGRVQGVKVIPFSSKNKSKAQWIQAKKAVILATGGFAADVNFRQQFDSKLDASLGCTNIRDATAETMQEAMRIGADTVDLEHIQLAPFTSPDEKGYGVSALFASYTVFPYGLLINPNTGKRFVNESADRKTRVDAMLSIGSPCIGIADAHGIHLSGQSIEKCLRRKVVKAFDDIKTLAAHYDIPKTVLSASLDRYNHFISQAHDDDFNRPIFKDSRPLTPPYYAVRLWPKVHYTMGGLRINSQAQVINTQGNVMTGLYAAGEVTGGVHGASRLSTMAITECLVFGRIAGQQAATL